MQTGVSLMFTAEEQQVFTDREKHFELNFFSRKSCSNQAGKIIFTVSQFVWCPCGRENFTSSHINVTISAFLSPILVPL